VISLALRGKKVNFDKVIKTVDRVAFRRKEQQDNDDKKEMYKRHLDKVEDALKVLETTSADLEKSRATGKEETATRSDEQRVDILQSHGCRPAGRHFAS